MESLNSTKGYTGKNDNKPIRLFHKLAVLTVLAGAGSSLGFTIYTGRHNSSFILILLFAGWVVSPFIALLLINVVTGRWSLLERLTLYSLMLLITVGSLVMYSGLWIPGRKTCLRVSYCSFIIMVRNGNRSHDSSFSPK